MSVLAVRDVMTREVLTVAPEEAADLGAQIMSLGRIRHLPVVEADGRLVGMLSQRDVLRVEAGRTAGDVMTRDVRTVAPDTSLLEAAETMQRFKIGSLPVMEDGRLVGILTEADFVDLAIRWLSDKRI
jgi:CBS domain-containing membrane protein